MPLIRLATQNPFHHLEWIRPQHLAPLDHFGNIQPSIPFLNSTNVAVSAIKPTRKLALRDARLGTDGCECGHNPAMAGRPELLRQTALSPKVSQCTLPQGFCGLILGTRLWLATTSFSPMRAVRL